MAGICDTPIISTVCDTVGEGAATLVAAPFDWLAQGIGAAAAWMFETVWALLDTTTLVDLSNKGYLGVYNIVFGIGVFLMLIFFCFQVLTGLIRRDHGVLGRAATGLAKSVLGSFLAITLITLLLEVVDQLCIGVVQASGTTIEEMGAKIGVLITGLSSINIVAPGAGAIITIFLSFLAICSAAIVWFSLLIRKTLILVAVVLAPVALSGASWDVTRGWVGKWASFLIALIVSKLVIVLVFLVAINQVDAPIDLDLASVADPVAGIVLMFVAGFAPYMVYKFISFIGFDMYHAISAEQEAKLALNRPIPLPTRGSGNGPQKILDGASTNSTGPSPASPKHAAPATPSAGAKASGGAGSAGTGGGGAATAGASGGAAAAGPVGIAAAAGVAVAKGAAEAGPQLGESIGQAADTQTTQAEAPPSPERMVPPVPRASTLPAAERTS